MTLFAAVFAALVASGPGWASAETLPGPLVREHSFELLSNSRYSVHSGFTDSLPRQVLGNVLWAMNRVPGLSGTRKFYVATRRNVYRYEPSANALLVHKSGDFRYSSTSAFEVGISCDRHEEAGMAVQAGLLAGMAFADSGVASCPMKWAADHASANWNPDEPIKMVNVYGRATVRPLDTTRVAVSSDTSLPAPRTTGADTFELVLLQLAQDSLFSSLPPTIADVSQLLWAGYGVTPHLAYNGRRGLTVPSAVAGYFLTGRVYLVRDEGVDRFRNRLPSGNMTTADHRLERFVAGDRRDALRGACARVPASAPGYIVVCVSDTASYQTMQEAGFVAFQYLMQARAGGLVGHVTMPLDRTERAAIASALSLPSADQPAFVFSFGSAATGQPEPPAPGLVEITSALPVLRPGEELRVEYLLRRSGPVRVEVFDLLGRPVRRLLDAERAAGRHSVTWDGRDADGAAVKMGSYVVAILSRGSAGQHKVAVFQ